MKAYCLRRTALYLVSFETRIHYSQLKWHKVVVHACYGAYFVPHVFKYRVSKKICYNPAHTKPFFWTHLLDVQGVGTYVIS